MSARLAQRRTLEEPDRRLSCYDDLATATDLEIDGKGSTITHLFTVTEPRLLRFESADAIMVVYLVDEQGAVVQNLHRGGRRSSSDRNAK